MSVRNSVRMASLGFAMVMLGCRDEGTDALILQLKAADIETRRTAVKELVDCEGDEVTAALASVLDDTDTSVRRLPIIAIGQRGPLAVAQLPSLLPALEDPELPVRLATALAIQAIEPKNKDFVPVLTAALLAGEGGIFLEVAEMGPDAQWAVPTLIRLLSHPETKIRALTAVTLGRLGPTARNAEPALRKALKDPQDPVRNAAQAALVKIQSQPVGDL